MVNEHKISQNADRPICELKRMHDASRIDHLTRTPIFVRYVSFRLSFSLFFKLVSVI